MASSAGGGGRRSQDTQPIRISVLRPTLVGQAESRSVPR